MKIGTKSVLYGAHCFFLHPWFVAWAWWKLHRFSRVPLTYDVRLRPYSGSTSILDPRLWLAFFVHDLGYVGKPNMDGEEGEQHPLFGARVMQRFGIDWRFFTLLHSRYFAKRSNVQPSPLCVADKLAIALTPAWLYLPLTRATGEIDEYRAHARHRLVGNERISDEERERLLGSEEEWYRGVQSYCARWVTAHRDGATDTWTGDGKRAVLVDGRWV
jgi:hypothetical protein